MLRFKPIYHIYNFFFKKFFFGGGGGGVALKKLRPWVVDSDSPPQEPPWQKLTNPLPLKQIRVATWLTIPCNSEPLDAKKCEWKWEWENEESREQRERGNWENRVSEENEFSFWVDNTVQGSLYTSESLHYL